MKCVQEAKAGAVRKASILIDDVKRNLVLGAMKLCGFKARNTTLPIPVPLRIGLSPASVPRARR